MACWYLFSWAGYAGWSPRRARIHTIGHQLVKADCSRFRPAKAVNKNHGRMDKVAQTDTEQRDHAGRQPQSTFNRHGNLLHVKHSVVVTSVAAFSAQRQPSALRFSGTMAPESLVARRSEQRRVQNVAENHVAIAVQTAEAEGAIGRDDRFPEGEQARSIDGRLLVERRGLRYCRRNCGRLSAAPIRTPGESRTRLGPNRARIFMRVPGFSLVDGDRNPARPRLKQGTQPIAAEKIAVGEQEHPGLGQRFGHTPRPRAAACRATARY